MSATVTGNVFVALFPELSVATLVTRCVPFSKKLPDGGTQTTLTEQLSIAVTLKFTFAPQNPGSLPTETIAGA